MIQEGFIRVGNKRMSMDRETCEEVLGGKWMGSLGCIVSSRFKYEVKDGDIYVHPEGVKKLPVLVPMGSFQNLTGYGGRRASMYTYSLKG